MLLQTEGEILSDMLMKLTEVQNGLLGVCIDLNISMATACQYHASELCETVACRTVQNQPC